MQLPILFIDRVLGILYGIYDVIHSSNNVLFGDISFATIRNNLVVGVAKAPVPVAIRTPVDLKVRYRCCHISVSLVCFKHFVIVLPAASQAYF